MYFYDCLNDIKHFLAYNFQEFREKMEYKKTIILLALVVFLLSIAGVSASEIGDTIASENANTIRQESFRSTLNLSHTIETTVSISEIDECAPDPLYFGDVWVVPLLLLPILVYPRIGYAQLFVCPYCFFVTRLPFVKDVVVCGKEDIEADVCQI